MSVVTYRQPLVSPVDQALVEARMRLDWLRLKLIDEHPEITDEELQEILRRDPSRILADEIVRLRREVARLLEKQKHTWQVAQ